MDIRIQRRLGPAFTGLVDGLARAREVSGPGTPTVLLDRVRRASVDGATATTLTEQPIAAAGALAPPPVPTGASSKSVELGQVANWAEAARTLAAQVQSGGGVRLGAALDLLGDAVRERDDVMRRARGELR